MKEIKGKNAVVTGGTSGIGRAIVLALAKHGANVMVVGTREEKAKQVAEEAAAFGVKTFYRKVDVSKKDEVFALADYAYEMFGSVEILVNNAGVTLRPFRAHWDTRYEEIEWVMNTNVWGVINGHMAFVPRMLKTPGEKHIVNTSSGASLYDIAGHSTYSASKAAVDGYSNSVREELKHFNIGVTIYHPGTVRTPITNISRLMDDELREKQSETKPWSDYITDEVTTITAPVQGPDPDLPVGPEGYITDKYSGEFVVEAILKNKPHVTTHPINDKMRQRFEDILNAVPDYSLYAE